MYNLLQGNRVSNDLLLVVVVNKADQAPKDTKVTQMNFQFLALIGLASFFNLIKSQGVQTCPYDVTLYNNLPDSWLNSNAKFLVNGTQSGSTMAVPLLKLKETYRFDVSPKDILSIVFNQNLNPLASKYSYSVYYQDRSIYDSLPTFQTVENPCQSTAGCEFSIVLSRSVFIPVVVEIFVDGIQTVVGEIPPLVLLEVINFSVKKDNIIQVNFKFPYVEGGLIDASYSLVSKPDGLAIPYYVFGNYIKGPETPASIPNYCGVEDLSLNVNAAAYTPGQTEIDVAVVPSFLASTQFPVDLIFNCEDIEDIYTYPKNQPRLTSNDASQKFKFSLPVGNLISCFFESKVIDKLKYPYEQSKRTYLYGIPVAFTLPSDGLIYQQGESVPVLLEAYDFSTPNATVTMICGLSVDPKQVTVGTITFFKIPTGTFDFCDLVISNLPQGYFSMNLQLTISTTTFKSPFGGNLTQIPQDQEAEVAQSLAIPGGEFVQITQNYQ